MILCLNNLGFWCDAYYLFGHKIVLSCPSYFTSLFSGMLMLSALYVQVTSNETSLVARCRRVYAHAHDYHINSISNNR